MKGRKRETVRYTIEREFLEKFTVTELINRMISHHMKEREKENTASP